MRFVEGVFDAIHDDLACLFLSAGLVACESQPDETKGDSGAQGGANQGGGGGYVKDGECTLFVPPKVHGCVVGPTAPWIPEEPFVPDAVDITGVLADKGNADMGCFSYDQERVAVISVNNGFTNASEVTWLSVEDASTAEVYTVGLVVPGLTDVFTIGSNIRIQAVTRRNDLGLVHSWIAISQNGRRVAEVGAHTGEHDALELSLGTKRCTWYFEGDDECFSTVHDMRVTYAGQTRSLQEGATETIADLMITNDAMSMSGGFDNGCEGGLQYLTYGAVQLSQP